MTSGHLLLDRQTYKIVFVEINVSAKSYGPNACELFLHSQNKHATGWFWSIVDDGIVADVDVAFGRGMLVNLVEQDFHSHAFPRIDDSYFVTG